MDPKIFGGIRIFGDTFLDDVIVKRNVRLNSGDYSGETLDESISSNNQTQNELNLIAKLNSNQGSGSVSTVKDHYEKMRTAATTSINSPQFKYETTLKGKSGFGEYFARNGIFNLDEVQGTSDNQFCNPKFKTFRGISFYKYTNSGVSQILHEIKSYNDFNTNKPFNPGLNIKSDVDINNSYSYTETIGGALKNGHRNIGPKVYIYRVKLFVTMEYKEQYLAIGSSSYSSAMRTVDYHDFFFPSSQARDTFVKRFKAYVDACKNI
jgi:hypothetical protein